MTLTFHIEVASTLTACAVIFQTVMLPIKTLSKARKQSDPDLILNMYSLKNKFPVIK